MSLPGACELRSPLPGNDRRPSGPEETMDRGNGGVFWRVYKVRLPHRSTSTTSVVGSDGRVSRTNGYNDRGLTVTMY